MSFILEPACNPYLPKGQTRVDAILRVKASFDQTPTAAGLEYGVVIDNSGSMAEGGRMAMAKIATRKATSQIPDGVKFFVLTFDDRAHIVVPLTESSPQTRAQADAAIAKIEPNGGTAFSAGLTSAARAFSQTPNVVRIVHMFTDGDNRESRGAFLLGLNEVQGRFQCECRGIGENWIPDQLLEVAQAMLGTAKIVATGADFAADMQETFASALARRAANVALRLIVPPKMARIVACKMVSPTIIDLTAQAIVIDDRTTDYPTGSWGAEERDYQITLEMKQPGDVGEQLRIARTAIVVNGAVQDQPAITVTWSDDASLTAIIEPHVAHYTGQTELAKATREGFEALAKGDQQTATVKLGRAMRLATESGNAEATIRLGKVVDVVDASQGTVKLRSSVAKTDLLDAEVGATRTVRRAPTPSA